jgi:hypothetical protein
MRQPSSSRLSYRNVLIAAGLAAALGVGSALAKPVTDTAPQQPLGGGQSPEGTAGGTATAAPAAAR